MWVGSIYLDNLFLSVKWVLTEKDIYACLFGEDSYIRTTIKPVILLGLVTYH